MPVQKCPLCLQTKEVVSSHLMPAALYDYCRPLGGNPVFFSSKLVVESSRQVQHPLLCSECEDILNKNGEGWIVNLFARLDGSFPLYDLLTTMPPAVVEDNAELYAAAQNPKINAQKIVHFAMGIFWKAAVYSWSGSLTEPLIDLGEYVEPIRKYLRGENPLPNETVLMLGVLPKPVKHISFTIPYQGSSAERNNFLFYTLGVEFTLLVGNAVTEEQRGAAFSANPARPILLANFAPLVQDIAVDVMKDAHKAKNVRRYLKKP